MLGTDVALTRPLSILLRLSVRTQTLQEIGGRLRSPVERKVAQYDKCVKASMVALDVAERLIFYRNEWQ
jgi:hypothetical protein